MSRFVRFDLSPELTAELLRRHRAGDLQDTDYRHQVLIGRFTKNDLAPMKLVDRAVVTSVRLLVKIMEKHNLSADTVAALRTLILRPVAAYKSATERDSIVVVTVELPDGINPLLVAIRVDVPDSANKPNIHWMVSAYAKDDPSIFQRWEERGLLIWKPDRQLEAAATPITGALTTEKIVAAEVGV
ncbi:hypothetical protein [Paraburkholderia sp. BCC1886]|uniref:MuF-C-terminal domain-containing protein n=1 Tax=Paraburkholderia sp. BCC1886 TaxID=2562670 RepID=UPI001181D0AA|nr:hypothetical protein [Paraburkholderia sp. BCC1886]